MATHPRDVFVNCPFDQPYRPLFLAIVFTLIRSGFVARCALETDDAGENRFAKICAIVAKCRYAVHDISRTEADGTPPLPRFNMPLELGLFLGAKRFGGKNQRAKRCIVFDRERYRYQRFISDIAGQDIHAHHDRVQEVIRELAGWLRDQNPAWNQPGRAAIARDYEAFRAALPRICAARNLEADELTFGDYTGIVVEYLATAAG